MHGSENILLSFKFEEGGDLGNSIKTCRKIKKDLQKRCGFPEALILSLTK